MQLNEILSLVLTNWSVVTISMFTLYLPVLRGCKILFGSLTAILNILLLINAPLAMKFHLKCTKILHSYFLQQANICLFHWNCSRIKIIRNIKKERERTVLNELCQYLSWAISNLATLTGFIHELLCFPSTFSKSKNKRTCVEWYYQFVYSACLFFFS